MKTIEMLKQHKPLGGRNRQGLKKSWRDQRHVDGVGK
jgi:hypothetical protein